MIGYDERTGIEEHMDHEMGRFANESQAALALSEATQEYPREQHKVDAVVAAGRYAVVLSYIVYCVHTDAALRNPAVKLISEHATRNEAVAALPQLEDGDEHWYWIAGPKPPAEPHASAPDADDIPF